MFKMTRWFLWGLFTLLLLSVIDQALLRVDLKVPGYTEMRDFYIDFRGRLIGLSGNDPIAKAISSNRQRPATAPPVPAAEQSVSAQKKPRYLYVDKDGALQFADSLDDIPLQYRVDAQPLSE